MIVYLVTNLLNGKRYVGATSRGLQRRWNEHVTASKTTTKKKKHLLHRAIAYHGAENFAREIIARAATREELLRIEVEMIRKFCSADLAYGYNLTAGGQGLVGFPRTAEHNQKISLAQKGRAKPAHLIEQMRVRATGRQASQETRDRISAGLTGRVNSAEARANMSDAAKLRWQHSPLPAEALQRMQAASPMAQRGSKKRPEHIEKMRAAALVREARKREASNV